MTDSLPACQHGEKSVVETEVGVESGVDDVLEVSAKAERTAGQACGIFFARHSLEDCCEPHSMPPARPVDRCYLELLPE